MFKLLSLRSSERLLVGYFAYVALIAPFFPNRPQLRSQPVIELLAVAFLLLFLAWLEERGFYPPVLTRVRDWLPILIAVVAFREMELFLPAAYPHTYETAWARQDHVLLSDWHLRAAVESWGTLLPSYLEACYFLVYGLPEVCLTILYFSLKRRSADRFLLIYLTGTLLAYSLFPYFPSQPPRLAFPGADAPSYFSSLRQLNLYTLRNTTIHTAVFPSAHVSSAFAAAWAMFLLIPERKAIAWCLLFYAVSVSVATVYGRYHYAADVAAGFAVSLVAALVGVWSQRRSELRVKAAV